MRNRKSWIKVLLGALLALFVLMGALLLGGGMLVRRWSR